MANTHKVDRRLSRGFPMRWLWYDEPNAVSNAISYAKFYSRSNDAVIRVYYAAGNVTQAGWIIDLAR